MSEMIRDVKKSTCGNKWKFIITPKIYFYVLSFEKGIAEVEIRKGTSIYETASIVQECFNKKANFGEQLRKVFGVGDELVEFKCKCHAISLSAKEENCSGDQIIEQYISKFKKIGLKRVTN